MMLYYKQPMFHGPAVKRLQEQLDTLDSCYDTGPNDGIFGKDTERALRLYQEDAGLVADGKYGPITRNELLLELNQAAYVGIAPKPNNFGLVDISQLHDKPKLYKCRNSIHPLVGLTVHQTGCQMPSNPMGWRNTNAHFGVTQEGKAIVINSPLDWIWHAQALSQITFGLEIEGNFCGIAGNEKTLWSGGGGPHHLNKDMFAAINRVLAFVNALYKMYKGDGYMWTVYGHRQSKDTRIADPGEEIWRAVTIQEKFFNFNVRLSAKWRSKGKEGRPIPKQWDSRSAYNYA